MTGQPALEVEGLHVRFPSERGWVHAVRGVSLSVWPGEVLGIVGESGAGKSATSWALMGLLPQSASVNGSVRLRGRELLGLDDRALSKIRGRSLSMVFQDSLGALTPVYTVGDQIAEALLVHGGTSRPATRRRVLELLDLVGIPDPAARASSFPHELSGGMRQRVVIAMAIANDPDVIIADEPTSALDVTVQAQVLEALGAAQRATRAGVVLVTHDMGVIAGFADRVHVMYAGRIVEAGAVDALFARPLMPYTRALLGSVPTWDDRRPLTPIPGTPPSPLELPQGGAAGEGLRPAAARGAVPPLGQGGAAGEGLRPAAARGADAPLGQGGAAGEGLRPAAAGGRTPPSREACAFAPRCPIAVAACREEEPALGEVEPGRLAACLRSHEVALRAADLFRAPEAARAPRPEVPRQGRRPVVEVEGLVKHHPLRRGALLRRRVGTIHAVDGVSFEVREGETLGLAGESGCGKTTTVLELLELAAPQAGTVTVLGRRTSELTAGARKQLRREMQVVFQDPLASLDPRMPVADILAEPLRTHGWRGARVGDRVLELLGLVGLDPAQASRYPLELSGGERQRVAIARALALQPRLLVLDEPVSSLDVSIRAGVLNLLQDLKARLGLTYLFVTHDLGVMRWLADRVAVMYLGRIVEIGEVAAVFDAPSHPYTQALLSAVPIPDPARERGRRRILLDGDPPSPAAPPSGCRFRTRCPLFASLDETRRTRCLKEEPAPVPVGAGSDQASACHYPGPR